jgi:hypothetical protein
MPTKDIAYFLLKKFGLGMTPHVTRRLYNRLEREAAKHGEPVLRIISECVLASDNASTSPGAWFRAAVSHRLREHGFLLSEKVAALKRQVDEQLAGLQSRLAARNAEVDSCSPSTGGTKR